MKIEAAQRLMADYDDESTVTFKIEGEGKHSVLRMLRVLAFLGSVGASRTIVIEDVPRDAKGRIEGGDMQFGFDGDGADKINDIMVDGKPYTLDDAFPKDE